MAYGKYHSRKTVVDGITFDSRKEASRWQELKFLERAGAISDLKRQVRFELIPSQRVDKKVTERACNYNADFTYIENEELIVEDAKGYRTPEYIIKRKLMLYTHGIRIREV